MAERPWTPSEAALEQALRELEAHLIYPVTPDLATAVRARLAAPADVHSSPWAAFAPHRRRLALAVLCLLLILAAALTLSPEAREALAGRIGLPGIAIKNVPSVPSTPPTATPLPGSPPRAPTALPSPPPLTTPLPAPPVSPTAVSVGVRLHLGEPVSLTAAERRVGFNVLAPAALGVPDEVYVGQPPPAGEVTLVYRPRSGLPVTGETDVGALIGEFKGSIVAGLFQKGVGPDSRIEVVTVAGGYGYWITGKPHLFFYQDANGLVRDESIRLAGNTLVWEQGGVTMRLESALLKDEALKVAASMR